jgi:hypothetical protein
MHGTQLQGRTAVPRAPAVRRDVARQALSNAANEFAIPRMEPGKQRAIQSMEEARDWERLFIGEIKAGRDPQRPPTRSIHVSTDIGDVSAFLDAYLERCVRPAALRSFRSVCSQAATLKEHLGHLPLSALEEPDEINRFKTNSDYAEDVEVASVHRVLETLRAAINWGMAQTPPLFAKSPFHRFGVRLNKKAERLTEAGLQPARRSERSARRGQLRRSGALRRRGPSRTSDTFRNELPPARLETPSRRRATRDDARSCDPMDRGCASRDAR